MAVYEVDGIAYPAVDWDSRVDSRTGDHIVTRAATGDLNPGWTVVTVDAVDGLLRFGTVMALDFEASTATIHPFGEIIEKEVS